MQQVPVKDISLSHLSSSLHVLLWELCEERWNLNWDQQCRMWASSAEEGWMHWRAIRGKLFKFSTQLLHRISLQHFSWRVNWTLYTVHSVQLWNISRVNLCRQHHPSSSYRSRLGKDRLQAEAEVEGVQLVKCARRCRWGAGRCRGGQEECKACRVQVIFKAFSDRWEVDQQAARDHTWCDRERGRAWGRETLRRGRGSRRLRRGNSPAASTLPPWSPSQFRTRCLWRLSSRMLWKRTRAISKFVKLNPTDAGVQIDVGVSIKDWLSYFCREVQMDDIAQVLIIGVGTSDPQKEDPARLSPTGVNVPAGLANEPPVRLKCILTPLSLYAQCSSKYCTVVYTLHIVREYRASLLT